MIQNNHDRLDQCILVLKELSEAVDGAQRYLFTRGDMCILDRGYLQGKINEMVGSLPESFRQAETIVTEEKSLRAQAAAENEALLAKAREQGRQLETEAQQQLDKANAEAQQIRAAAEHAAQDTARQANEEAQRILREARQQADSIRAEAEKQLREAVSRENVLRVAQVEADEIRETTRKEMNELHDNVFDYLNGVMGEIERFLGANLQNVRTERKELNDHRFVQ
ncbi:MAG: hypothetical protein J1E43_03350 [Christensenellaceae bacterium]|nr:hypothetical protein [Christensenellaceae bacterium]